MNSVLRMELVLPCHIKEEKTQCSVHEISKRENELIHLKHLFERSSENAPFLFVFGFCDRLM